MKYFKLATLALVVTFIANFAHAENKNDLLAIEYLEISKTKEVFDMTIDTYVQQLSAQNPGTNKDGLRNFLNTYMSWEVLKDPTIKIVSKIFTEKELLDIIAFYKSESGKSYADKSPQLSAEISKIISANLQKAMSNMSK